jgi:MFS family permease
MGTISAKANHLPRFFFHERVRRINIWVFCLLGGPFLGPFVAGMIATTQGWRADYGILAALHGFATLLVVVLGDETLYDRHNPQPRQKGIMGKISRLTGIAGAKVKGRPNMLTVLKDIVVIQIKPQIALLTVIYVMVLVAWVIGVNVTISLLVSPPPWAWGFERQALSWLAPLIGAIIGEFWGHWFNDFLQRSYIRRHNGLYVLENRLWGTYVSTFVGVIGLILYGQAFQHVLHWMVVLVAWAMIAFSMIAGTTAVSAYCLDAFPYHSSLVASIINLWR